jgi:hypothetical protein
MPQTRKSPFSSQGKAEDGFISLFSWQMRSLAAKSQSGSANLATLASSLPMGLKIYFTIEQYNDQLKLL